MPRADRLDAVLEDLCPDIAYLCYGRLVDMQYPNEPITFMEFKTDGLPVVIQETLDILRHKFQGPDWEIRYTITGEA